MKVYLQLVICVHLCQVRQGALAEPGINDNLEIQGEWSEELLRRLTSHACQVGQLNNNTTLLHGLNAGEVQELGRVRDVEVCVLQCCESHRCELAFFVNNYCYGIRCYSQQHCKTVPVIDDKANSVAISVRKERPARNVNRGKKIDVKESPSKKTSENLVFYPVDSDDSHDLAFSVNLRKIAKHYINDDGVKRALTDKANEHLDEKPESRNKTLKKGSHSQFDIGEVSRRHGVSPVANPSGEKRTKIHPKENNVNDIEWDPRLLKAAISSSSVAIIVIAVILLSMGRRKQSEVSTEDE